MSGARTGKVSTMVELSAHKLFAPPDYAGAIRRDAVLERIFCGAKARIILFQAPAGHGKSTLLQQAKSNCEERGFATGWLSFDEADNDIRRFSIHLQALLTSALGEAADRRNDQDLASRGHRSGWFVNRLLRFERPIALFLDELQTLKNRSILSFLRELLEHIPDNAIVFLGSRATPEIGLARLVVNHQALILNADDLRFTLAEVQRFFAAGNGGTVNDEELAAICKQTEGWPAALQLFRLSLSSPAVRASLGDLASHRPRELAEYLADNVLALQPPRIRDFLLRTSLLTRLCAPLCDAVTGGDDAQETLLFLERSGLFLRSLDSGRRWFKYHNLFSSFLAEQLREESETDSVEVHRAAAAWHRQHGLFEEAVYHAIEIHDYGFAAEAFDIWASRLVADGYLMTVERWFDHLPLDELEAYPALLVKTAYALVFLRRHQKLKPVMRLLEGLPAGTPAGVGTSVVRAMAAVMADDLPRAFEIIRGVDLRNQQPDGFLAFELGAAANLSGFMELALGRFEAARETLALGRAYGKRAQANFSGGYSIGVMGFNLIVQGALGEALEKCRASMTEQKTEFDKSFASASLVACQIWALYQADQLDEAEALFAQHHDIILESVLLDFLAVACIAMARIHEARGRYEKTLQVLDEAENVGYINRWPRLIRIVARERLRQALLRGETDKAESIAARILQDGSSAHLAGWILFSEDVEDDAVGEARLLIHRGDCDASLRLLDAEVAAPQSRLRVHRQIKLTILSALAHHGRGAAAAAQRALRGALRLALPGRFVRTFLEEGPALIALLADELGSLRKSAPDFDEATSGVGRFVELLLASGGVDVERSPAHVDLQPLEPLTEKERKILVYLSNGISNKAMARQIFLSENTVKFHLKNIYSKLAVSSRVQAINAARQMGII